MGKVNSKVVPFALILLAVNLLSCSQGNCRRKHDMPGAAGLQQLANAAQPGGGMEPVEKRILVFKYDGSLQCGSAKGQGLNEMQKELGNIKVFSSQKKPDGLMHIQVCGAATGMANVYEILATDLALAEKHNFRLWKFD